MTGETLLIFIVGAVATCIGLGCLFAALRDEWQDWVAMHPFKWKRNKSP